MSRSDRVAGLSKICDPVILVLHAACGLLDVESCQYVGYGVVGGHGDDALLDLLGWRLVFSL